MMTDEEILHKATLMLEQLSQQPDLFIERILREVTDDEMVGVEAVLQKIAENPRGVLAFDELFGDKTRLVIDFPVKDTDSELGQFVHELEHRLKVTPDWDNGMVSIKREWTDYDRSIDDQVASVMGQDRPPKTINKKIQMKIGRYFVKLDELVKEWKEIRQKIGDHTYKDAIRRGEAAAVSDRWMLHQTSGEEMEALSDQELKHFNKIRNQLALFLGSAVPGAVSKYVMSPVAQEEWRKKEQARRDAQDEGDRSRNIEIRKRKPIVLPETKFIDLGLYWVNKAKWVKENINTLENNQYSIILTRHPVDMMRMSDFEEITSCQSPKSRDGGGMYYKCAVAEAQGHGAVAYVVETEDLLSETNTGNIQSAEQELEEYDEIFAEQERYLYGTNLDLEPVERTRLRQFRYYDDADNPDIDYQDLSKGTELAVPEKDTYGADIPGLVNRVVKWARKNQEETISKMPRDGYGLVNLDNFWIFGGSYEFTEGAIGREALLTQLTGLDSGEFIGDVRQNTETEDWMPASMLGDISKRLEDQCQPVADEWNPRYAVCQVEYKIIDQNGQGDYAIWPFAKMRIVWDVNEWDSLPNPVEGSHAAYELNDMGYGYFNDDNGFIGRNGDQIVWGCDLATKMIPTMGNSDTVYDGEGFDNFCQGVSKIDKMRDQIKELLERYFKRDGSMEGGQYVKLAIDIENGELDPYYWDVKYDGESPDESYEAWATPKESYDFDPEELNIEPRVLFEILDSRDFRHELRDRLLAPAQKEVPTEYHLDIRDSSAVDSGGDIRYSISFQVTAGDPDKRVQLFRELVNGEMDDEDEISKAFISALSEIAQKNGVKLNLEGYAVQKSRDFDSLKDLGEVWRRFI